MTSTRAFWQTWKLLLLLLLLQVITRAVPSAAVPPAALPQSASRFFRALRQSGDAVVPPPSRGSSPPPSSADDDIDTDPCFVSGIQASSIVDIDNRAVYNSSRISNLVNGSGDWWPSVRRPTFKVLITFAKNVTLRTIRLVYADAATAPTSLWLADGISPGVATQSIIFTLLDDKANRTMTTYFARPFTGDRVYVELYKAPASVIHIMQIKFFCPGKPVKVIDPKTGCQFVPPGFRFLPGLGVDGINIECFTSRGYATWSVASQAAACSSRPACRGFDVGVQGSCLKATNGPLWQQWEDIPCFGFYYREGIPTTSPWPYFPPSPPPAPPPSNTTCPSVLGYLFRRGEQLVGADFFNGVLPGSLAAAGLACTYQWNCLGFASDMRLAANFTTAAAAVINGTTCQGVYVNARRLLASIQPRPLPAPPYPEAPTSPPWPPSDPSPPDAPPPAGIDPETGCDYIPEGFDFLSEHYVGAFELSCFYFEEPRTWTVASQAAACLANDACQGFDTTFSGSCLRSANAPLWHLARGQPCYGFYFRLGFTTEFPWPMTPPAVPPAPPAPPNGVCPDFPTYHFTPGVSFVSPTFFGGVVPGGSLSSSVAACNNNNYFCWGFSSGDRRLASNYTLSPRNESAALCEGVYESKQQILLRYIASRTPPSPSPPTPPTTPPRLPRLPPFPETPVPPISATHASTTTTTSSTFPPWAIGIAAGGAATLALAVALALFVRWRSSRRQRGRPASTAKSAVHLMSGDRDDVDTPSGPQGSALPKELSDVLHGSDLNDLEAQASRAELLSPYKAGFGGGISSMDSFDSPCTSGSTMLDAYMEAKGLKPRSAQAKDYEEIHDMKARFLAQSVGLQDEQLEVFEVLGRGGSGTVYRALWKGLPVAAKMLLLNADLQEDVRQRMREATMSAALHHPNIVHTYLFDLKSVDATLQQLPGYAGSRWQGDGMLAKAWQLVILQELCVGGSLRQLMGAGGLSLTPDSGGDVSLVHLLQLAHDVACGLEHLHSKDIVHSDLTPSNVLLQACAVPRAGGLKWIAKVADFGLSIAFEDGRTHASHMYAGTPHYIAPETQGEGIISKQSDIFTLGVLLHELFVAASHSATAPQPAFKTQPLKASTSSTVNDSTIKLPTSNPSTSHPSNISSSWANTMQPSSTTQSSCALQLPGASERTAYSSTYSTPHMEVHLELCEELPSVLAAPLSKACSPHVPLLPAVPPRGPPPSAVPPHPIAEAAPIHHHHLPVCSAARTTTDISSSTLDGSAGGRALNFMLQPPHSEQPPDLATLSPHVFATSPPLRASGDGSKQKEEQLNGPPVALQHGGPSSSLLTNHGDGGRDGDEDVVSSGGGGGGRSPLQPFPSACPDELRTLVTSCLSMTPHQRPAVAHVRACLGEMLAFHVKQLGSPAT